MTRDPRYDETGAHGTVEAVHASATHSMAKSGRSSIRLLAGLGVEGDAHAGTTVKHRSRVRLDPTQPNLRQVHLIHGELHDELRSQGYTVAMGEMGENITTRGLDLLGLPQATRLLVGDEAVLEVTGLRNPCRQLDGLEPGLLEAVCDRDDDGRLIRKAGVMAVVVAGGEVRVGDAIVTVLPPPPLLPLRPV